MAHAVMARRTLLVDITHYNVWSSFHMVEHQRLTLMREDKEGRHTLATSVLPNQHYFKRSWQLDWPIDSNRILFPQSCGMIASEVHVLEVEIPAVDVQAGLTDRFYHNDDAHAVVPLRLSAVPSPQVRPERIAATELGRAWPQKFKQADGKPSLLCELEASAHVGRRLGSS